MIKTRKTFVFIFGCLWLLYSSTFLFGTAQVEQGAKILPQVNKNYYDAKEKAVKQEITDNPTKPDPKFYLASLYLEEYSLSKAKDLIDQLSKSFTNDTRLTELKEEYFFKTGNFKNVIETTNLPNNFELTKENLISVLWYIKAKINLGMSREMLPLLKKYVDFYNNQTNLSSKELTAIANAIWIYGTKVGNIDLIKMVASGNYPGGPILEKAIQADPSNYKTLILWGNFYLEKNNNKNAIKRFQEALKLNPSEPEALINLLAVNIDIMGKKSVKTAIKIIETFPEAPLAWSFYATVLYKQEQWDEMPVVIEKGLKINPNDTYLLALKAGYFIIHMKDKKNLLQITSYVEKLNPFNAEFYLELAELCTNKLKFSLSAKFINEAVKRDGKLWAARAIQGLNLVRNGKLKEGKAVLEEAFDNDPFDIRIINTIYFLNIIEQEYTPVKTKHFIIYIHKKEVGYLSKYASLFAEEAWEKLTKKYNAEQYLSPPITVFILADHRDLSVITGGIQGLGILGVCFGNSLAIDSPYTIDQISQMGISEYNWGVIFWHEFTHTVSLSISNFNVPRWFTEGMSTYEESASHPGWGRDMYEDLYIAYKQGRLASISDLIKSRNIMNLYYYGSLIVEYINDNYGAEKITKLLLNWKKAKSDNEAFKMTFNKDINEIESEINLYIKNWASKIKYTFDEEIILMSPKTQNIILQAENKDPGIDALFYLIKGNPYKASSRANEILKTYPTNKFALYTLGSISLSKREFKDAIYYFEKLTEQGIELYKIRMGLGYAYFNNGNPDKAESEFLLAIKDFPNIVEGKKTPYQYLIKIYQAKEDTEKLTSLLKEYISINHTDFQVRLELLDILKANKDYDKMPALLDEMKYINPKDIKLHIYLGKLFEQKEQYDDAIDEYNMAINIVRTELLKTSDKYNKLLAQLYYYRAKALSQLNQFKQARNSIQRCIELLPDFKDAYILLEEIKNK